VLRNALSLWLFFIGLTYVARRDRRLLARCPQIGLVTVGLVIAVYLVWRLSLHPGPPTERDALFLHTALLLGSGFAVPQLVAWGHALAVQDLPRIGRWLQRETRWVLVCGLLAVVGTGVYFAFGTRLAARGVFERYDTLFGSDPVRYARILSATARDFEYVTHKHPLFPLVGRSLDRILAPLVGETRAPLAVSSAAGGLCLALAAAYFRRITGSRLQGVLAALLLGSTAAHVVFAALPETYTLSAASLILLHLLLAQRRALALRLRHQALAAVFSVGVTATNVVPALVCFAGRNPSCRRARAVFRWFLASTLIGILAIAAQSALWPAALPGRAPDSFASDVQSLNTAASAGTVLRNLGRGLFLENIVGTTPRVVGAGANARLCPGLYVAWPARLTAALWIGVAFVALLTLRRVPAERRPTLWAAVLCLITAAAIHTFYGSEHMFLYSCTYTFYVLAVVAHALKQWKRPWANALLTLLVGAVAVQNARFAGDILGAVAQVVPAHGG
jgi:hypothetical protein